MILDVGQIIAQLGKEKGIDKAIIIDAIKEALESAARKKFGANKILEATYDPDTGEFEILSFRTVSEVVSDPDTQMTLDEAQAMDPEAQVGDYVIVHVGFALSKVDEAEANQVFEYLKQMEELS